MWTSCITCARNVLCDGLYARIRSFVIGLNLDITRTTGDLVLTGKVLSFATGIFACFLSFACRNSMKQYHFHLSIFTITSVTTEFKRTHTILISTENIPSTNLLVYFLPNKTLDTMCWATSNPTQTCRSSSFLISGIMYRTVIASFVHTLSSDNLRRLSGNLYRGFTKFPFIELGFALPST